MVDVMDVVGSEPSSARFGRSTSRTSRCGFRRRGGPRIAWHPAAAGDGADGCCERRDVVEQAECDEVIGPAGKVLSALAGADQDAVSRGQSELANLDIGAVMMQGDFAGNGDALFERRSKLPGGKASSAASFFLSRDRAVV